MQFNIHLGKQTISLNLLGESCANVMHHKENTTGNGMNQWTALSFLNIQIVLYYLNESFKLPCEWGEKKI